MRKRRGATKASSRSSSANGTVSGLSTPLTADLQYADCTWEKYDEIKEGAQAAIEEFHTRQQRTTVPARSIQYAIHARPTYTKINEDTEYLLGNGGALKPFQLTGLNWLAYVWSKGENGILADEVGYGRCSADFRWDWAKPSNQSPSCRTSSTRNSNTAHSLWLSPSPPFPHGKCNSTHGLRIST